MHGSPGGKATVNAPRPVDRTRSGAVIHLRRFVAIGVASAAILGALDALTSLARPGVRVSAGRYLVASLELPAMYVPIGLATGLLIGLACRAVAVRGYGWLERLWPPGRWLTPEPTMFAWTVATLIAAGGLAAAFWRGFVFFATRFHRPELAGIAAAGAGVLAAAFAVGVAFGLAGFFSKWTARLGRGASVASVLALLLFTTSVAILVAALSGAFAGSDPLRIAWLPIGLVLFVVLSMWRRWSPMPWIAFGIAAPVAVALFYSESNATRSVIERRSVGGPVLHRLYTGATDWDRDGHSWAFGGGDCNDFDRTVFPGAVDVRGDGIDSDCLGGDGSPIVEDFGDGAYGTLASLSEQPNILFVTVDALRPDHVGFWGYERPTTPEIDRFASDSVAFRDVIATSSKSIRSLPSVFTGFYPSQVEFGPEFLYPSLSPSNRTVAELLSEAGYQTRAVVGTNYFERVGGFFQGFERYEEIDRWRARPEPTVALAMNWLRELDTDGKPWFLWVDLMNTHAPYLVGGPPSRFGSREIDAYDTEIALADRQVGRLVEAISRLESGSNTVVIIASDHGEAFGEHGDRYHASSVYQEQIHAVLFIRVPGVEPHVVDGPVSLVDLAPTFLNLADIPVPQPMPARSLVPLLTGETFADDRLFYSEVLPDGHFIFDQKMVRRGDQKLIWWVRENRFQLFDLGADPAELNDLSDEQPETASELRMLLQAWTSQTARPDNLPQRVLENARLESFPETMTRRLDLDYEGSIRIVGFDLPRREFGPNERIPIVFYLESLSATSRSYRIEVTFESDRALPEHFHAWHFPLNGHYLTSQWRAGDRLRDPVEIVVPHDVPRPSRLRMMLEVRDGTRRVDPAGSPDAKVELATLRIRPG